MTALFDAADYGPETRRAHTRKPPQPNATYSPTWILLGHVDTNHDGRFHKVSVNDWQNGSIITVCGDKGRRIDVSDELCTGQPIIACEDCLAGRERADR